MILGVSVDQWLFILKGAGWTLGLAAMGFVGGTVIGLPVAVIRASNWSFSRKMAAGYIGLVQGIPLPVVMFLCYFGISIAGYNVPALVAAGLAMTLYSSAFLGEIWRGCIEAIPRAQWEASRCLALTHIQTLTHVVIPQAFRVAIPPTVNFMVQILKNTSYAVVIGFVELTYSSRVINNSTFNPFIVFTVAAIIYFVMCYPLSILSYRLEKNLRRYIG